MLLPAIQSQGPSSHGHLCQAAVLGIGSSMEDKHPSSVCPYSRGTTKGGMGHACNMITVIREETHLVAQKYSRALQRTTHQI